MSYIPVNLEVLLDYPTFLPCDVYVRDGDQSYTKVFSKGTPPSPFEFAPYKRNAVNEAWIPERCQAVYFTELNSYIKMELENEHPSDDRFLNYVEELTCQSLSLIGASASLDAVVVESLEISVASFDSMTRNDVFGAARLLHKTKKRSDLIRHLVSTSVFSILLARKTMKLNQEEIVKIAIAGLLHDLGLTHLPCEIDEYSLFSARTRTQDLLQHPMWISQLDGAEQHLDPTTIRCIQEHHESWSGGGYPQGLQGNSISYPARILAVADSFSSLTIGAKERPALSPRLALHYICQNEGLDPKLVQIFCQLFTLPTA